MGISVPLAWSELGKLTGSGHWTIRTVDERLRQGNALWEGYDKVSVSISAAMKRLGYTGTS
jgi:bifunctional non-homologous end joining protein LigD